MRVKWQAPPVTQSIHLVAGGDPKTPAVDGVAFSDILLYGITRGDADSLATLDCQHYHGLHKGSPIGREQPKSKPQKKIDAHSQLSINELEGLNRFSPDINGFIASIK